MNEEERGNRSAVAGQYTSIGAGRRLVLGGRCSCALDGRAPRSTRRPLVPSTFAILVMSAQRRAHQLQALRPTPHKSTLPLYAARSVAQRWSPGPLRPIVCMRG